jgi:hypothetical protein
LIFTVGKLDVDILAVGNLDVDILVVGNLDVDKRVPKIHSSSGNARTLSDPESRSRSWYLSWSRFRELVSAGIYGQNLLGSNIIRQM